MKPTSLLATVTICTRNRAESLDRTLASVVSAASYVSADWEMIVVDNGSTDHTADVIHRYSDRLPIRRVAQEVPGLSNARNAGLAEARGRFIVWTDDDVLVDEAWLRAYFEAFTENPGAGLFGGRAIPRFEEPRADWFIDLAEFMPSLLAVRDMQDVTEIAPDNLPFGLNYAVRTDVQRRFQYDPALGVAPGRRIGGEETGMLETALADGVKGLWVWDATVYHLITPERQTLSYIYDYYYSQGKLYPRVPIGEAGLTRMRRFRYLSYRIFRQWLKTEHLRRRNDRSWVLSYMEYARLRGSWRRLQQNNVTFS